MKQEKHVSILSYVTAVIMSMLLVACGGGGGGGSSAGSAVVPPSSSSSSSASSQPTLLKGVFTDSPVQGLSYTTSSGVTGTTSAIGEYNYYAGDTVTFRMYGTTLNTQAASVVLTPADSINVDVDYTVNLLRFLQTVDTDHNPANGITLPTVDATDANIVIPFGEDLYAFEADPVVLTFIGKYAGLSSLVGIEDAINHFNATIQSYTDTILDITGVTMTQKTSSNLCSDQSVVQTTNYTVTATGYSFVTNDAVGYKSPITKDTKIGTVTCAVVPYTSSGKATFANLTDEGTVFFNGPVYTYPKMNRISIRNPQSMKGSTSYGLKAIEVYWYTPGTNTITGSRHFIKTDGVTPNCPYYTTKEVFTITGRAGGSSSSAASSVAG